MNAWRRDNVSAIGPDIEAASLAAWNRSAIGREREIEMAALVRDDAVRRRECAKPLSEFEKEFCSLEAVDIDNDQPAPRSGRNADVRVRRARPPIPDFGFVARRVFETVLRDWFLAARLARENGEPVAGIAEGEVVPVKSEACSSVRPPTVSGAGAASSASLPRSPLSNSSAQAFLGDRRASRSRRTRAPPSDHTRRSTRAVAVCMQRQHQRSSRPSATNVPEARAAEPHRALQSKPTVRPSPHAA